MISRASFYTPETRTMIKNLAFYASLSWLYAACSQVILHLPFVITPLSLQPAPVLLLSILFGRPAFYAYLLYLIQGACGAPFFAFFGSGINHLIGPTGGFLAGFALASAFLVATNKSNETNQSLFVRIQLSNLITFSCGLAYLSLFVPTQALLFHGLLPFVIGDFFIKPILIIGSKSVIHRLKNS